MAAKISQLVNPHSTCFTFMKVVYYLGRKLELRQFKNGLASVKSMLVLKLPHFFPHLHGKLPYFFTEGSYFVLALSKPFFSGLYAFKNES